MYFIFFIGSTMNYEADAGIDLELWPFLAVGQNIPLENIFLHLSGHIPSQSAYFIFTSYFDILVAL